MWDLVSNLFRGRFSLAVLLLVVTWSAIACGVARWKWAAAQERAAAVAALVQHGYEVRYPWQLDSMPFGVPSVPAGPAGLRAWLGDDFFNEPVSVHVAWYGDHEPVTNADSARVIEWLNALPSLEEVELDGRAALGEPLGDLRLPHLRQLNLSQQHVTDADLLRAADPARLEWLYVAGGKVTGSCFPTLFEHCQLRGLMLTDCPLEKQWLELVAGEESLENIYLSSPQLTDEIVARIARLPQLSRVWFAGRLTERTCESLSHCPLLQSVTLKGVPLTPAGLAQLAKLPMLAGLDLRDCGVSEDAVETLLTFPALDCLTVSGTPFKPESEIRLRTRFAVVMIGQ